MDSLTQIILGAAVGEVILGKRIGNRAMVCGAVGGTIPDLDILANAVMPEIEALAFHRAISHSFFFSLTGPLLFAWLARSWYRAGWRHRPAYPYLKLGIWLLAYLILTAVVSAITLYFSGEKGLVATLLLVVAGVVVFKKYFRDQILAFATESQGPSAVSYRSWYWLFFGAFFTHILLDVCTTYGTQIFQPFSNYRSALSSIAVVDPAYTVPFLFCLILSSWQARGTRWRRRWNWIGIITSSLYLIFTMFNKAHVNEVWRQTLSAHNLSWQRIFTSPTLFNNILWHTIAEADSVYYQGDYALTDHLKAVKIRDTLVKNHHLLTPYALAQPVKILTWFSHGYYAVTPVAENTWHVCDLRYGGGVAGEACVMGFIVTVGPNGEVSVKGQRPEMDDVKGAFRQLGQRLKGE